MVKGAAANLPPLFLSACYPSIITGDKNQMSKNEKHLEFTQAFVSPVHGNVYIGKTAHLPTKEADVLIAHGVAVEIDSEAHKKLLAAVPETAKPPVSKADPYKGMTAKEKKAAIAKEKLDAEIATKQARLDELAAKEGLSDEEADEANALEAELEKLKG